MLEYCLFNSIIFLQGREFMHVETKSRVIIIVFLIIMAILITLSA